jgi:CRISPR-associated protein Cas5t
MKVIRFEVEGVFNSFKVPFFRTYHKTLLAPPKTTIIGMLCNIALKPEKEFYKILEEDKIMVSVVIDGIEGKTKDLWSYKTLKLDATRGKSVIQRDKLYKASYTIYLKFFGDNLFDAFYKVLLNPKNIPSLGMDDEVIYIKNITDDFGLENNLDKTINSVFLDKNYKYKIKPLDTTKAIILPTFQQIPIKFRAFDKKGKRVSREPVKEAVFNQVEFINCEVEFLEDIETFMDNKNNRILFY